MTEKKDTQAILEKLAKEEIPSIKKETAVITSQRYQTAKSIPLVFHFEERPFASAELRIKQSMIQHIAIDSNDIYTFDGYFLPSEGEDLRKTTEQSAFSRSIVAGYASQKKGEEPARAMDNKEKWKLFSTPPKALSEVFKFLSFISFRLNAKVTTLPWELYDQEVLVPTFATNLVEKLSKESETFGKHEDYNTEKEGLCFEVPILYPSQNKHIHPQTFINGEKGRPWLITIMLFATSVNFLPEYGLGSIFCKQDGTIAFTSTCHHMRFCLFEGNIIHGIEQSHLPSIMPSVRPPWRVSYVLKIILNPKDSTRSLKKDFYQLIQP